MLLGITKAHIVPLESQGLVSTCQGYLPITFGNILGVVVFGLLAFLAIKTRTGRMQHGSVAPLWQDMGKLAAIAVVIVGFVHTLNQYEGIPVPVLATLIILGIFSFIANKTVFGRRIYSIGSNASVGDPSVRRQRTFHQDDGLCHDGPHVRLRRPDHDRAPRGRLTVSR